MTTTHDPRGRDDPDLVTAVVLRRIPSLVSVAVREAYLTVQRLELIAECRVAMPATVGNRLGLDS